jgi:hypothetical protein
MPMIPTTSHCASNSRRAKAFIHPIRFTCTRSMLEKMADGRVFKRTNHRCIWNHVAHLSQPSIPLPSHPSCTSTGCCSSSQYPRVEKGGIETQNACLPCWYYVYLFYESLLVLSQILAPDKTWTSRKESKGEPV